jgi:hypothetical protein
MLRVIMPKFTHFAAACAVAAMFSSRTDAARLAAGAAVVELQPPAGILMAGYSARTSVSKGVLDPLHAKILVIEGADRAVALVTLDLVGVLPAAQLDDIRARVKASAGIEDVIFNASHTHSGPALTEQPPAWQIKAADDIVAGIGRAWQARRPARIGIGRGSVEIGHNRLYYMANGQGRMLWRNETRLPTSPVDPTVMILRVDSEDGKPVAVLVNYACHAVVLGPENLDYSADWPGEMARGVEAAYPGSVCLFVQGAAGDINPYYDKTPLIEDALGSLRATGRAVANEVLQVMPAIHTREARDSKIHIAREVIEFAARWDKDKVLAGVPQQQLTDDMRNRLRRATAGPYQATVTTLLVGREFAFVGVPAEIFVDYQIDIRNRVRDFPVLFGGYTNGNLGYVPTIKAAVDGGYGANQLGAFIEVGAGNRMIDAAVIRLGYWTGKLRNRPAPAE